MALQDFAIVCGLSTDGEPDDWLHLGIPVHTGEIWEFQFSCCHKSGAPDATVVGSFVMFDNQGNYVGTTPGSISNVTDATTWTLYAFQYPITGSSWPASVCYVFPAIWWHAATPLGARYVSGVQVANVSLLSSGGTVVVLQPDIFLTLGAGPPTGTDPGKVLAGAKSKMGPT